jgi:Ca2+/Na+ antiporter
MKMKTNNIIYFLAFVIFLILCSTADGKTSISGGVFLVSILSGLIFFLRKGYKKDDKVLNEDCSMDEQV